jgi:hypothetical protein
LPVRFAALERREMRVHRNCIHSLCGKLVLLILHQGDERADDDGQAGQKESWKLVDE